MKDSVCRDLELEMRLKLNFGLNLVLMIVAWDLGLRLIQFVENSILGELGSESNLMLEWMMMHFVVNLILVEFLVGLK